MRSIMANARWYLERELLSCRYTDKTGIGSTRKRRHLTTRVVPVFGYTFPAYSEAKQLLTPG